MIFAAILAGGIGSRMNLTNMPKQFLMLGDRPILIHTLEKFLLNLKIDIIYLGVHKDWIIYTQDLVDKYIADSKERKRIKIVSGGKDRNGTIINIVKDIENNFEIAEEDIIITHDAVRPFITARIIEDNIKKVYEYGACDTVISAIDTIVCSKDGKFIEEIPDRRYMYQGQTPQTFKIKLLEKLYDELSEEEKENFTDACKIFVVKNKKVSLVDGEIFNMKITTQDDYRIAKSLIGGIVNND